MATTASGTLPPAQLPAGGSSPRPGLLERLDRRLNPILVKDIRVWLRSRLFLAIYFTGMLAAQLITIAFCLNPLDQPVAGREMFTLLMGGLTVALVGVVPWLMQDSFAEELTSRTTELTLTTRLTPGQLVRGKILSGLAAAILFFSAVGPSLIVAYMLGGIDLLTVGYAIFLLLLVSSMSMLCAVLLVAISGRRRIRTLGVGLVFLGLLLGAASEPIIRQGFPNSSDELALLAFVLFHAAFAGWFLYTVAVNRLSFAADNRDGRPRAALTAWTLAGYATMGAGVYLVDTSRRGGPIEWDVLQMIGTATALFIFLVGSLFLMNTPDTLSARVRSTWPRLGMLQLLYQPGKGRLYAYLLAHPVLLVLIAFCLPDGGTRRIDGVDIRCLALSLMALTALSGGTLMHTLMQRMPIPGVRRLPRGLTVLVCASFWLTGGAILGSLARFTPGLSFVQALSPIEALDDLFSSGFDHDPRYFATGFVNDDLLAIVVVHSCLLFIPMLYWARTIAAALMENRVITVTALERRLRDAEARASAGSASDG